MTYLLSELQRSSDPRDTDLARMLEPLAVPADQARPRASDALAAFIAAHDGVTTPAAAARRDLPEEPDHVVLVGPVAPTPGGPAWRRPVAWAAAVVLGAGAAVAGVGLVAAGGPSDDVVVVPAAEASTTAPAEPTPRAHQVTPSDVAAPSAPGKHSGADGHAGRGAATGAEAGGTTPEPPLAADRPVGDRQRQRHDDTGSADDRERATEDDDSSASPASDDDPEDSPADSSSDSSSGDSSGDSGDGESSD